MKRLPHNLAGPLRHKAELRCDAYDDRNWSHAVPVTSIRNKNSQSFNLESYIHGSFRLPQ